MLLVSKRTLAFEGVEFVKSVFRDNVHTDYPFEEIEPKDDALPVLITRIGLRSYRVEYWYCSSASDAHRVEWIARSEAQALKLAARRVEKLKQIEAKLCA